MSDIIEAKPEPITPTNVDELGVFNGLQRYQVQDIDTREIIFIAPDENLADGYCALKNKESGWTAYEVKPCTEPLPKRMTAPKRSLALLPNRQVIKSVIHKSEKTENGVETVVVQDPTKTLLDSYLA